MILSCVVCGVMASNRTLSTPSAALSPELSGWRNAIRPGRKSGTSRFTWATNPETASESTGPRLCRTMNSPAGWTSTSNAGCHAPPRQRLQGMTCRGSPASDGRVVALTRGVQRCTFTVMFRPSSTVAVAVAMRGLPRAVYAMTTYSPGGMPLISTRSRETLPT